LWSGGLYLGFDVQLQRLSEGSSLFGCKGGGCRDAWSEDSSNGLYLHERLARQLEDVRLRADALERAGAAVVSSVNR
jgi:hypothetical protein